MGKLDSTRRQFMTQVGARAPAATGRDLAARIAARKGSAEEVMRPVIARLPPGLA